MVDVPRGDGTYSELAEDYISVGETTVVNYNAVFRIRLPVVITGPRVRLYTIYSGGPTIRRGLPTTTGTIPFCASCRRLLRGRRPSIMRLYLPRCLRIPISRCFTSRNIGIFYRGPINLGATRTGRFIRFRTTRPRIGVNVYLRGHLGHAAIRLGGVVSNNRCNGIVNYHNFMP